MTGRWLRALAGAAILGLVVWWVGPAAFVAGVRGLRPADIIAAVVVGAVATLCSAWRWRRVARLLGAELPMRDAVVAYYRSQFLNATLPLGVVGDVHRAFLHRGLRHGA